MTKTYLYHPKSAHAAPELAEVRLVLPDLLQPSHRLTFVSEPGVLLVYELEIE